MKDIKDRFAESPYMTMRRLDAIYELKSRAVKDLEFLKDRVDNGQLTKELYDFINMDGSLSRLFPALPAPGDNTACEALQFSQSAKLEQLIATENIELGKWIARVWQSFKDWYEWWVDLNRYALYEVTQNDALYRQRREATFGDAIEFDSRSVTMYRHNDWVKMVEAVQRLVNITKTIPSNANELSNWVANNKAGINTALSSLGWYIDEKNIFREGTPSFIIQNGTCVSLGWRLVGLGDDLSKMKTCMDEEIAARKLFYNMERLFTSNGDNVDRASLMFIKKTIVVSRSRALVVCRALNLLLREVKRAKKATDYKV